MKRTTIIFLFSMVLAPTVFAENIKVLQQRASFAYEQMMKAKHEAEVLSNDAVDAEKHRQQIEENLVRAKNAAEAARQRSNEANVAFDQAMLTWKKTSEALAQEWGKVER